MLFKTRGIVLRTFKYSETSLIAEIYTEEKGLRKYIISGVRTKKPKFAASLLQHMSLVEMVAYDREGKDLNRIKELKAAHVYQHLPFDIRRSSVGLFMTEVAQKTLKEPEQNGSLFHFLFHTYVFLDQTSNSVANIHLYFLANLSAFLGFAPNGGYSKNSPYFNLKEGTFMEFELLKYDVSEENSQALSYFLESPVEACHACKISKKNRAELLEQLIQYYQLHLENFLGVQAHAILKEVLF